MLEFKGGVQKINARDGDHDGNHNGRDELYVLVLNSR